MNGNDPLGSLLVGLANSTSQNACAGTIAVSARFSRLLENLRLTDDQRQDGITKHGGVRSCLNWHYYTSSSASANSLLVGSWGKNTEIRPPRDVDVLFALTKDVYDRFESRPGNKQSQLLQEVKTVLQRSYPNTRMKGDGQVVVVPFVSYAVEVVPAFRLTSGQYWICDTNDGGKYKLTHPDAEVDRVRLSNTASSGNTRDLIRMLKRWQEYCNVPLKSFVLELLAIEFLETWTSRGKSTVYYDWLIRDFFAFLKAKSSYSCVIVPGTWEAIPLGDGWQSRAESAHARAEKATKLDAENLPYSAGEEWQKLFGTFIPIS